MCEFTVKLHDTLNHLKREINAPCLSVITEYESLQNPTNQGVVAVYKFTSLNEDGTRTCKGDMMLAFNLYNLPRVILSKPNALSRLPNTGSYKKYKNKYFLTVVSKHEKGNDKSNNITTKKLPKILASPAKNNSNTSTCTQQKNKPSN